MLLKLLQCLLMNSNCLAALFIIIEMWWLKVKSDENVISMSLICVTMGNIKLDIE